MGWDLGRGKLSTVGVSHRGFLVYMLYIINHQSRTQLSKVDALTQLISMTRSRACFYRSRSRSIEFEVGTGTVTRD